MDIVNGRLYFIKDDFTEVVGKIKTKQLGDINSVKAHPIENNFIATASDDGTVVLIDKLSV